MTGDGAGAFCEGKAAFLRECTFSKGWQHCHREKKQASTRHFKDYGTLVALGAAWDHRRMAHYVPAIEASL
jgi:hypothetical protein